MKHFQFFSILGFVLLSTLEIKKHKNLFKNKKRLNLNSKKKIEANLISKKIRSATQTLTVITVLTN